MSLFYDQKVPRLSFGRLPSPAKKMELNSMQLDSYKRFIGTGDVTKEASGIHAALESLFPIESVSGYVRLEYVDYTLVDSIYDTYDCKRYGTIYGAELKVKLRLVVYDSDSPKDNKKIKHKIEEEVSLGDMPLMTPTGSFIINGTERVVVSQLHRSPGVFFVHDKGKSHASRKLLYQARIIPYRGSWLDFEFDIRDRVYFRIDRKRKMPVSILLKALGFSAEEILAEFYETDKVHLGANESVTIDMPVAHLRGLVAPQDIANQEGEIIVGAGERILPYHIRQLEEDGASSFNWHVDALYGRVLAHDIVSSATGEVVCFANQPITEEMLAILHSENVTTIKVIYTNDTDCGAYISQSMALDSCVNRTSALFEIYHMIRPGDPANKESAEILFENSFFNEDRYSLSAIGRMKLNATVKSDETTHLLTKDDIVGVIKHLIAIRQGQELVDDIDSLGNRRVRSVGEMVENQFRLGLFRIDRAIQDALGGAEADTMTPKDFLNAKPVNAAIKEFFATGQMSQFMDQNNPLSEITHKRRITVLGPGGLSRDRSGFEVRDVHTTHYGRLCPIETPEGPNIGLINSLTTFAKTDDYGFLITPYLIVKDGLVTDEMTYCSVGDEKDKVIAQADQLVNNDSGKDALVPVRINNEFMLKPVSEIDYMDVSPKQIVSVAASLIPFLEHDDANRALMGSNMQRQAIPVLRREKPYVGTGMESVVAIESGTVVVAKRSGEVVSADSKRIVIKVDDVEAGDDVGIDIYNLVRYQKSNHNTCIDQTPIVVIGAHVRTGDVIADGSCTDNGELALGQNVRIAFMSWNGYNFEDSIIISERLVQENHFTSIHIEEFSCIARSTKLGDEEITSDIPNVTEYLRAKLDESGIVHVGEQVQPGDILVGKITPKGETQLTPEEKLLRAVFGEKASDVKDSSLRMSSGMSGTVVDVQVQMRGSNYHSVRSREIEQERLQQIDMDEAEEMAMLVRVYDDLRAKLATYASTQADSEGKLTVEKINKMSEKQLLSTRTNDTLISDLQKKISTFGEQIKHKYENKRKVVTGPSSLSPGVLTIVKVFVAIKRNIQPGDKMAGRHGNKGVISAVVPMEDMPYDENGVAVDMILNPLGVPSRMNVGQILETHLGMASRQLGHKIDALLKQEQAQNALRTCLQEIYGEAHTFDSHSDEDILEVSRNLRQGVPFATPVFDGAKEANIAHMLRLGGLDESGKITLYDGRTGEQFDQAVTVGYMYMLKLNHLVDDKMHARSTGSYSLVTQQPLGGKAQFGGQRFGEMEVWALEAYGAAYTLQEMLTVKSDDMEGRKKMYKNLAEGEQYTEFGIPESFNVLVREIRSLALDIDIE